VKLDASEVYFGKYATDYDKRRENSKNWIAEQAAVLPELAAIQPGERVLDIPGGTGRWLEALKQRGAQTTLFDVSDDMLAIARKKAEALGYPIQTIVGNALTDPYPAADWVISVRFLNKISLDNVRHVLETGRRAGAHGFIFNVRIRETNAPLIPTLLTNAKEKWRRVKRRIKRGYQTTGGHIHEEVDIRRLIHDCGLVVETERVSDHYAGRRNFIFRLSAPRPAQSK